MTKCIRAGLIIAVCLSLSAYAQKSAAPLAQVTETESTVQTVQFQSKLVGKTLPYNVILPIGYNWRGARSRHYPVLYLLHGLFGHYDNWATRSKLPQYAARYQMIIVTPEGHDNWYTDSATVPSDKYETYILEELIPDVQRRFRTLRTRAGRAIAGLSMGGYGALKFGVKFPDRFVFVGSLSGAFGAASWKRAELTAFDSIYRTLVPVFGPENSSTRTANDVYKLYRNLPAGRIARLPYIYLDCGTEDPLLPASRILAEVLTNRKIPHEYREFPGKHDWVYWDAHVRDVLTIAARKFARVNQTVSLARSLD